MRDGTREWFHTPGPWSFRELGDGHVIQMGAARNPFATSYDSHHEVHFEHGVSPKDGDGSQFLEAESNARLMAASPELLEGCLAAVEEIQMLLRRLRSIDIDDLPRDHPTRVAWVKCKQGISRARRGV